MASMRASRIFFCSSVSVLHLENKACCSSVRMDSPSAEKNWARVIPIAWHTASNVGIVGALLRLNIFVMVEWESPDSLPRR